MLDNFPLRNASSAVASTRSKLVKRTLQQHILLPLSTSLWCRKNCGHPVKGLQQSVLPRVDASRRLRLPLLEEQQRFGQADLKIQARICLVPFELTLASPKKTSRIEAPQQFRVDFFRENLAGATYSFIRLP
jgi:hypothetical protein